MWNIQDAKFHRWPVDSCEGLDYQQTGLPKGGGTEKDAGATMPTPLGKLCLFGTLPSRINFENGLFFNFYIYTQSF